MLANYAPAMSFLPSGLAPLLAVSLPSFLTPDRLRWIIPLLTVLLLLAAFWVVRFVTKLAIKAAILGVLALFVFTLWIQRGDLADCAKNCECSLYGIDVDITQEQFVEYGCKK